MIKFINVNKSFNNNSVLNNLNLSFNDNEITLISGKSGKGKTTILNLLCKPKNFMRFIFEIKYQSFFKNTYYRSNI